MRISKFTSVCYAMFVKYLTHSFSFVVLLTFDITSRRFVGTYNMRDAHCSWRRIVVEFVPLAVEDAHQSRLLGRFTLGDSPTWRNCREYQGQRGGTEWDRNEGEGQTYISVAIAFIFSNKISLANRRAARKTSMTRRGAEKQREAFADTSYWPVYLFPSRDYPLVRFANGCAAMRRQNGGA